MKQHISLIFSLALLLAVSFGCKVGDEDPASLASRDGRLAATWNLTAAEVSDVRQNQNGTTIETESYDGTTWTTTEMGQNTTTDSFGYEMQLVIEKGGKATYNETIKSSSETIVATDSISWSWVDADKGKSKLIIYQWVFLNGPEELLGTWEVLRLSKKELVLYQHYKRKTAVTGSVFTGSASKDYTRKFTFEAE